MDKKCIIITSHYKFLFAIVGRLLWGLISQLPYATAQRLYFISCLSLGLVTVILPSVNSYSWMVVLSTTFGLSSGNFGVSFPQLIIKALGVDMFNVGYGYACSITAIGYMGGPPVAGWILFQINLL